MRGNFLVINSGSSSLKFAIFGSQPGAMLARTAHGRIEDIGAAPRLLAWGLDEALLEDRYITLATDAAPGQDEALTVLLKWLERHAVNQALLAVGHRVVHGGALSARPTRITPDVIAQLEQFNPLAPLHQPHGLAAIRAIASLQPDLPQFACFDTTFHVTQSWAAQAFALPQRITQAGVKRYGFHGLSYEYIASELPAHLGRRAEGRVVVAHLGNGASLCALHARKSVATTMGFTALDGLMMGSRCGSLDPGVVLYLLTEYGMSAKEVEKLLYEQSGLLGVSGISSNMRTLEASSEPDAEAAITLYVHCIIRELGALVAILGGLDALVFTAGIGEHSVAIRRRVCLAAAWLGLELDEDANRTHRCRISAAHSRVSALVIPTNEEWMIAQHTQVLIGHEIGA